MDLAVSTSPRPEEPLLSPRRLEIIQQVADEFRFLDDHSLSTAQRAFRWIRNGGKSDPPQLPPETFDRLGEGKYSEAVIPKDDPSLVLKFLRSRWRRTDVEGVHPLNNLERTASDLQILKDGLPQNLPRTELTTLAVRGGQQVLIAQERIRGEDLDHALPSDELKAALAEVLDSAVALHVRHLTKIGDAGYHCSVVLDLKGENFIWGRPYSTPSQPARLYLIDSYPVEGCEWVDFIEQDILQRKARFLPDYFPLFDRMREEALRNVRHVVPKEEFSAGCQLLPLWLPGKALRQR